MHIQQLPSYLRQCAASHTPLLLAPPPREAAQEGLRGALQCAAGQCALPLSASKAVTCRATPSAAEAAELDKQDAPNLRVPAAESHNGDGRALPAGCLEPQQQRLRREQLQQWPPPPPPQRLRKLPPTPGKNSAAAGQGGQGPAGAHSLLANLVVGGDIAAADADEEVELVDMWAAAAAADGDEGWAADASAGLQAAGIAAPHQVSALREPTPAVAAEQRPPQRPGVSTGQQLPAGSDSGGHKPAAGPDAANGVTLGAAGTSAAAAKLHRGTGVAVGGRHGQEAGVQRRQEAEQAQQVPADPDPDQEQQEAVELVFDDDQGFWDQLEAEAVQLQAQQEEGMGQGTGPAQEQEPVPQDPQELFEWCEPGQGQEQTGTGAHPGTNAATYVPAATAGGDAAGSQGAALTRGSGLDHHQPDLQAAAVAAPVGPQQQQRRPAPLAPVVAAVAVRPAIRRRQVAAAVPDNLLKANRPQATPLLLHSAAAVSVAAGNGQDEDDEIEADDEEEEHVAGTPSRHQSQPRSSQQHQQASQQPPAGATGHTAGAPPRRQLTVPAVGLLRRRGPQPPLQQSQGAPLQASQRQLPAAVGGSQLAAPVLLQRRRNTAAGDGMPTTQQGRGAAEQEQDELVAWGVEEEGNEEVRREDPAAARPPTQSQPQLQSQQAAQAQPQPGPLLRRPAVAPKPRPQPAAGGSSGGNAGEERQDGDEADGDNGDADHADGEDAAGRVSQPSMADAEATAGAAPPALRVVPRIGRRLTGPAAAATAGGVSSDLSSEDEDGMPKDQGGLGAGGSDGGIGTAGLKRRPQQRPAPCRSKYVIRPAAAPGASAASAHAGTIGANSCGGGGGSAGVLSRLRAAAPEEVLRATGWNAKIR